MCSGTAQRPALCDLATENNMCCVMICFQLHIRLKFALSQPCILRLQTFLAFTSDSIRSRSTFQLHILTAQLRQDCRQTPSGEPNRRLQILIRISDDEAHSSQIQDVTCNSANSANSEIQQIHHAANSANSAMQQFSKLSFVFCILWVSEISESLNCLNLIIIWILWTTESLN